MEPNNFLNRKKLNLDLVNRNSYKATSSKVALIHPLMKYPLQTLNSKVENNDINNLGFFIPINNYESKNIKYTVNEQNVVIDSADRDVTVYKNPLRFSVKLNPLVSDYRPYITQPCIKNLKYIQIVNVMLPLHYQIYRKQLTNDGPFIEFIEAQIKSLSPNSEVKYGNLEIQICNVEFKEETEWEVNYTVNRVKVPLYTIIKNKGNYITYEYKYIENILQNKRNIFISIEEYNDKNVLSTDNHVKFVAPLEPKKIQNNFIIYDINNRILFKNSNLSQLRSLNISFLDHDGAILQIPFLDAGVVRPHKDCKCCDTETDFSCLCYYLRHPFNSMWQTHIIIKIGSYELIL